MKTIGIVGIAVLCIILGGIVGYTMLPPQTITVYREKVIDNYNEGYNAGYDAGYNTGYNVGYNDGYDGGYDVGYTDGYNYMVDWYNDVIAGISWVI